MTSWEDNDWSPYLPIYISFHPTLLHKMTCDTLSLSLHIWTSTLPYDLWALWLLLKVNQWKPSCSHQQFFKKILSFWFNEGRHETLLKHHKNQPQGYMNTSTHTHSYSFALCPRVHGVTHNDAYFASRNKQLLCHRRLHKVYTYTHIPSVRLLEESPTSRVYLIRKADSGMWESPASSFHASSHIETGSWLKLPASPRFHTYQAEFNHTLDCMCTD